MRKPQRRLKGIMVGAGALALLVVLCFPPGGAALAKSIIRVPQDYASIQEAIDAATTGDTVLVSPGTYHERIDFGGKTITVESEDGPATTTIDGDGTGVVVVVNAAAGETPVLRGFTITGGGGDSADGGVDTSGGPELIEGNRIVGNDFCDGGAVEAAFSAATIRRNRIAWNAQTSCSGGVGGGGISIRGAGTVSVLDNVISGNRHGSWGGGLTLFAAGAPTISGNTISRNVGGSEGGGMWLVNNTIAANAAAEGSAVYSDGFDSTALIQNNILAGAGSAAVVECGEFSSSQPVIAYNDVFNPKGHRYGGLCADQSGQNGNIAGDPLFVAPGKDFRPQRSSPAVESGFNSGAPPFDIDGDARPFDADGDGDARVDMGADEVALMGAYRPLAPGPPCVQACLRG